uniref:Uncharacterized protein n=1 Tax=Arundo donax TaxID=35708 RepID=A0A0A9HGA6_ARUDO
MDTPSRGALLRSGCF